MKSMNQDLGEKLSVVITADSRKQFLLDAVRSILNSHSCSFEVEVIIAKNFLDEEIDTFLKRNNIISIMHRCPVPIWEKNHLLELAVTRTTGSIIVFLDDDDLVHPDRLRSVCTEFAADPDLVYFHNNQEIIGLDDKRNFVETLIEEGPNCDCYISIKDDAINVAKLFEQNPDRNLSSIAIRKEICLPWMGVLDLITGSDDTFFFYCALSSGKNLIFSCRKLTYYRVYFGSITHPSGNYSDFQSKRATSFSVDFHSHVKLSSILHRKELNEVATGRVNYYAFLKSSYEKSTLETRFQSFLKSVKWLRLQHNHPPKWYALAQSIILLFFSRLAISIDYLIMLHNTQAVK